MSSNVLEAPLITPKEGTMGERGRKIIIRNQVNVSICKHVIYAAMLTVSASDKMFLINCKFVGETKHC